MDLTIDSVWLYNLRMKSSILPHILPEKESLLEAQYVAYLHQVDLCQPQSPWCKAGKEKSSNQWDTHDFTIT